MRFTVPSVSRFTTSPCTTLLDDSPPPVICERRISAVRVARGAARRRTLQTRTLSTLKGFEFLGHTSMHALATRRVIRSSHPYCLLEMVPCSVDSAGEHSAATETAGGTHPQPLGNLSLVLDIQHVRAGNDILFKHRQRLAGKVCAQVSWLPCCSCGG